MVASSMTLKICTAFDKNYLRLMLSQCRCLKQNEAEILAPTFSHLCPKVHQAIILKLGIVLSSGPWCACLTPSGPSLWTLHKILRTHGWALGTKQTEMGAMIVSKLEATLNWKSSSEIHCEKRRKESWSWMMACFLEATFHLPFETQLIHYSNRDTLLVLVVVWDIAV